MKITVNLNQSSVRSAIAKLQKAKSQLPTMLNELLMQSCEALIVLANQNLEWVGIGDAVKEKIKLSWSYTVKNGVATLINSYQKAVYVEFGTGIVGEENPHKMASSAGYEYNVDSPYKDEQGRWTFYADLEELDLPIKGDDRADITYFNEPNRNSTRMLIRTSGAPATMFVFNAILRFKSEKHGKILWDGIKAKYWG